MPNKNQSQSYYEYVMHETNDNKRLVLQHAIFKPNFLNVLEEVLGDYHLTAHLENAKKTNTKIKILDAGCGEGLFLQDIEDELKKRGFAQNVEFYGIDIDAKAIETAKRNITAMHLEVVDLTKSFEDWNGIEAEQFDFIYLTVVMEHLPNPRHQLQKIYQALKPGGIIYLRSVVLELGKNGWVTPHPALIPFVKAFVAFTAQINGGAVVAREHANWLAELGATKVKAVADLVPTGGSTPIGIQLLRNAIWAVRNAGPLLVSRGFLEQSALDNMLATLATELTPQAQGQMTFIDTLALKPK